MECRPVQDTDLDLVSSWNRQLQENEGAIVMEADAIRARLERWLAAGYEGVVFLHESTPIGYALFRPTDPDRETPGGVHPRQFFIAREQRRRGFGTAAFHAFVAHIVAGRRLVLEVLESNPEGRAFWLSLGLEPYSSTLELPVRRQA